MRVLKGKLSKFVPIAEMNSLTDFIAFEHNASHGYEISQDSAEWALDAIPDFLENLKRFI